MDKLVVHGDCPLNGSVRISGAKNAVLPIMTATIIAPGSYKIKRVPDLRDTCLLYTSPSPRDGLLSRMPSSA